MNKQHKTKVAAKMVTLMALVAVMTGCAAGGQINGAGSIPVPQWLNAKNAVTLLSEQHSRQIDNAQAGELVTLGASPWGENTHLRIGDRYFSATGKICFITNIESAAGSQSTAVCKYPEGKWGATRSYTSESMQSSRLVTGGMQ